MRREPNLVRNLIKLFLRFVCRDSRGDLIVANDASLEKCKKVKNEGESVSRKRRTNRNFSPSAFTSVTASGHPHKDWFSMTPF
jgi:hypothetical protein